MLIFEWPSIAANVTRSIPASTARVCYMAIGFSLREARALALLWTASKNKGRTGCEERSRRSRLVVLRWNLEQRFESELVLPRSVVRIGGRNLAKGRVSKRIAGIAVWHVEVGCI